MTDEDEQHIEPDDDEPERIDVPDDAGCIELAEWLAERRSED